MGIKSFVKNGLLEVWPDLYDARMDDKAAPDLADVINEDKNSFYSNPEEFFGRTYLTSSMQNLIEDVAKVLSEGIGGATFILTSLFGGGKTHTKNRRGRQANNDPNGLQQSQYSATSRRTI